MLPFCKVFFFFVKFYLLIWENLPNFANINNPCLGNEDNQEHKRFVINENDADFRGGRVRFVTRERGAFRGIPTFQNGKHVFLRPQEVGQNRNNPRKVINMSDQIQINSIDTAPELTDVIVLIQPPIPGRMPRLANACKCHDGWIGVPIYDQPDIIGWVSKYEIRKILEYIGI